MKKNYQFISTTQKTSSSGGLSLPRKTKRYEQLFRQRKHFIITLQAAFGTT